MLLTEDHYRRYVDCFNARDYTGLEAFFTDDFVLEVGGFAVRGKPAFRRFYAFVHSYVRETVTLKYFFAGKSAVAANVAINFFGLKDMSQAVLDQAGYSTMTPVPTGASVDVEFIIVYELNADNLVRHIRGAVYIPAA